ncbi:hypothetical protein QBZ16_003493 [Prototheca wickerhamii]|uniref:Tubulin-folding cofactor D ARM repeats domain-containing protein n=1 Tax=Prototheca wickerhamii TaxID=3111 RepID=A0AAD9II14_PROWI|nr:hypothetical protein QBZ16_003493 [Prototheca wickerhamii]
MDADQEDDHACQPTSVLESDELSGMVAAVLESQGGRASELHHAFVITIGRYQEQPQLLDGLLEGLIWPLARLLHELLQLTPVPLDRAVPVARWIWALATVRGWKVVSRFLPSQPTCMEPVVWLLEALDAGEPAREADIAPHVWELECVLLMWLTVLVLLPFDLSSLDSREALDPGLAGALPGLASAGLPPLAAAVLALCVRRLSAPSRARDMAAHVTGRLVTRPDAGPALDLFGPQGHTASFTAAGAAAALAATLKRGDRRALLPFAKALVPVVEELGSDAHGHQNRGRAAAKLAQRVALVLLARREGGAISCDGANNGADASDADADAMVDVETLLDVLLKTLVVRWSAAKGVGRLAARLPADFAAQVVEGTVDACFGDPTADAAWHGGCLALAELVRGGRLPAADVRRLLAPVILPALRFELRRGASAVGAHVRDAAAYACWALARAPGGPPRTTRPARRWGPRCSRWPAWTARSTAAARARPPSRSWSGGGAAGRTASPCCASPTTLRCPGARAFLEVAPAVARFEGYFAPLAEQLLHDKLLRHWEKGLRELAARAAAALARVDARWALQTALPLLLDRALSAELEARHGAVAGLAELLGALPPEAALASGNLLQFATLLPRLDAARLNRGKGGEVLRSALCRFVATLCATMLHADVSAFSDDLALDRADPWPLMESTLLASLSASDKDTQSAAEAALVPFYQARLGRVFPRAPAVEPGWLAGRLRGELLERGRGRGGAARGHPESGREPDVEVRQAAVASLTRQALHQWRALEQGETFSGMAPAPMDLLTPAIESCLAALQDYTIDNRGDVGSWARETALSALQDLAPALQRAADAGTLERAVARRAAAVACQQAVERIGRVREAGWRCVARLWPMDDGYCLFATLRGLAYAAGARDADVASQAAAALTQVAEGGERGSGGADVPCPEEAQPAHRVIGQSFLVLWDEEKDAARARQRSRTSGNTHAAAANHSQRLLGMPLLTTAEILLSKTPLRTDTAFAAGVASRALAESTQRISDIARLQSLASLLGCVAALDNSSEQETLHAAACRGLLTLMRSRFPAVRRAAAEQLYLSLLAADLEVEAQEALDLLGETDWADQGTEALVSQIAQGLQGGAAIKPEKRRKVESPEPREGGRFLRRRRPEPVRTSTVLPCRGGGQVGVEVEERGADIRVTIRLLGREAAGAGPAALLWGVCRGSMRRWHHPQGVAPAGSVLDETSGAMRSPFPHGKDAITLTFRAGLAPATLAFAAAVGHRPVLPLVAPHFAVPLGMLAGDPRVLGPSRGARGVNFAVASASARGMSLVLFSRHRPGDRRPAGRGGGPGIVEAEEDDGSSEWTVALELELDPSVHRTGAVWHVGLPALRPSADLAYAWRVDGEEAWDGGNRTQPDRLLLDPQAPSVTYLGSPPSGLGPLRCPSVQRQEGEPPSFVLSGLGSLRGDEAAWRPSRADKAAVPPADRRTMLFVDLRSLAPENCLAELVASIDEFRALGLNTLVLSACYATAWTGSPLAGGRAAVSHAALDPSLAPGEPGEALARAIATLHAAGFAVLMQVDFTFTAEGDDENPNPISLRGLDHAAFYRPGAVGVLNAGHAVVRQYILATLRRWALDFGFDGFYFLGAENLVQDRNGCILDAPPLAMAIAYDPVLAGLQFVAQTADARLLPRQGRRGFPALGRVARGGRRAGLGAGRADRHARPARRAGRLRRAVRAGWAGGVPGALAVPRPPHACVNELRLARYGANQVAAKAAIALALLAAGTPLLALEEAARHARFVGVLARLRRRWLELLQPVAHPDEPKAAASAVLAGPYAQPVPPEPRSPTVPPSRVVAFHGAAVGSAPDWDGSAAALGIPEAAYFAVTIAASAGAPALYYGMNTSIDRAVSVHLPHAPAGHSWHRLVDTNLEAPEDAALSGTGGHYAFTEYVVQPGTGVIFVAGQPEKKGAAAGDAAPIAAANSELHNGNAAAPAQQLIEQAVAGRLDGAPPSQPIRVIVTNEVAVRSVVPPAELYRRVVDVGVYKGTQPWWKIAVGGVLAGVYTAFGGIWLLSVGPNCPGIAAANPGLAKLITGAVGLPIGLITIFTCGGDLFTGNTAVVTAALIEKKVTLRQLLKSWTVSYLANLVGCALGILLAHTAGLTPQLARGAIAYATYKTSAPLGIVLARAIGANWFVCLAVWQCTAAQTYLGKALACAMPLTAFITIGLEHSIANMFFVPLGILAGADTTLATFVTRNLIPVTIGNILAGSVCVAAAYSVLYGRLGKRLAGEATD